MLIFVFFLGLIFLGLPVSFSFVVAGIFYLLNFTTVSPNIIATTTFTGIDNFALLAIPFFIFAGDIMREGGISKRLVSFAKLFFKNSMTAYGTICIVGCAFFGAISGSAVAAVAAIGGIMIPEMIRHRYKREYAGSLASAAGYLGMLIPPSVPIVLYCITSGDSIGETFIAGVVPGLLAMVAQIIVNKIFPKKFTNTPEELLAVEGIVEEPASEQPHGKDLLKVLLEVIPGILMPVIILGGIYAGIFTATEAAAVSIVYGTFVSVVLYKEISLKDIPRVAVESAKTAGKVLVIVAFASFFGRLLTLLRIPSMITTAVLGISSSPTVIMLIIISLLFVFGMVMDMSVSIILLVPIIQPIMLQLGLDPVHIAMIIVFALGIGLITPPMALNLFVGSQISKVPMSKMVRPIIPYVVASLLVLLLIVLVPQISTLLPSLLGY